MDISTHPYTNSPSDIDPDLPDHPIQSTPDYVLNPLSIYRMARRHIPERHFPERILPSSTSTTTSSSSNPNSRHPSISHSHSITGTPLSISSAISNRPSTTTSNNTANSGALHSPTSAHSHPCGGSGAGSGNGGNNNPHLGLPYDPTAAEQASFEQLQNLFTADPGWTWQPAETAIGSMNDSSGFPPWEATFGRNIGGDTTGTGAGATNGGEGQNLSLRVDNRWPTFSFGTDKGDGH